MRWWSPGLPFHCRPLVRTYWQMLKEKEGNINWCREGQKITATHKIRIWMISTMSPNLTKMPYGKVSTDDTSSGAGGGVLGSLQVNADMRLKPPGGAWFLFAECYDGSGWVSVSTKCLNKMHSGEDFGPTGPHILHGSVSQCSWSGTKMPLWGIKWTFGFFIHYWWKIARSDPTIFQVFGMAIPEIKHIHF